MKWYAKNAGNDYQGLVIDEQTGRNVAVAYDKEDATLLSLAPELRDCLQFFVEAAEAGVEPNTPIHKSLLAEARRLLAAA